MTGWDLTTHMWVWLINELSLSNYYCCAVNSLFTRNSEEGVCTPPPMPASAEGHSVLSAGRTGWWAVGGGLRGPEDPLQPDCTLAWGCWLQWRKDDVMTKSVVIITENRTFRLQLWIASDNKKKNQPCWCRAGGLWGLQQWQPTLELYSATIIGN